MTKKDAVEILSAHLRCLARSKQRLSVDRMFCEERINELRSARYNGTQLGEAARVNVLSAVVREANRLPLYPESRK